MTVRAAACIVLFALGAGACQAEASSAVVTYLSGSGSYAASRGGGGTVKAYMSLAPGDVVRVEAGARMRVVYLEGGRQESYVGPATFTVHELSGSFDSTTQVQIEDLPRNVTRKMAVIPDLVNSMRFSRMAGSSVRAQSGGRASSNKEIAAAKEVYARLRKATDDGDVTPELYLASVLLEHERFEEIASVVEELRRRSPNGPEAQAVEAAARSANKR